MASLNVRKLDDRIYEQLRIQAAKHGVSMEEEARQIITRAVLEPESIHAIFQHYFGHRQGIDLECIVSPPHDPLDLSE